MCPLDTCRICSAPGEPDQPLFYPCKCSGTILDTFIKIGGSQYPNVCRSWPPSALTYLLYSLTTWLAHSKKKTCDVCKHPCSFTKRYAQQILPYGVYTDNARSLCRRHAFETTANPSYSAVSPAVYGSSSFHSAGCRSCNSMACGVAVGHCLDMENVFHDGGLHVRLVIRVLLLMF